MEEIKLDVEIRARLGSRGSKEVRKDNYIPAVVYGGGEHGPVSIKVERAAFEKILRQHQGESILFHLTVLEDGKKLRDYAALVKDAQHDALSGQIIHIDFIRVSLKEEVEVMVPLVVKGEAPGLKEGGTLDQILRELAVVCLPTDMPQNIEVDVSNLGLHESVCVKDITLPQGVKTNHDPEASIATVAFAAKEEEPVADEDAPTEPEVIGEKKDEGEAESEDKAEDKAEAKADAKPEAEEAKAE